MEADMKPMETPALTNDMTKVWEEIDAQHRLVREHLRRTLPPACAKTALDVLDGLADAVWKALSSAITRHSDRDSDRGVVATAMLAAVGGLHRMLPEVVLTVVPDGERETVSH